MKKIHQEGETDELGKNLLIGKVREFIKRLMVVLTKAIWAKWLAKA